MSKSGTYSSIDGVLNGVKEFVDSHRDKPDHFTGFKIQVYLGRGVHTFNYEDKESDAQKKVSYHKKQLELAEKELEDERNKNKRHRSDSNEHDYRN